MLSLLHFVEYFVLYTDFHRLGLKCIRVILNHIATTTENAFFFNCGNGKKKKGF